MGKTTDRGYGHAHQRLRQVWVHRVNSGGVTCSRCGRPILPGMAFDLDHDDYDRSRYRGAFHVRCNRQTSKPKLYSRKW
jgi:hypothetical protein